MKLTILSVIISLSALAIRDGCGSSFFWSDHLGMNIECFCSGVTDQCHAGLFDRKEMTVDFHEIRGFLEWPNRPVGSLEYYFGGWELAYVFDGNDGNGAFVWEVPFKYNGSRTRMYGSLLKFTHKIQPTTVNPPVHLQILSNEVNLTYIVPEPEDENSYYNTRTIILSERGAYVGGIHSRQQATKTDVMRALMSAYKILIYIEPANKYTIILNSPKLYVAVDEITSDTYKADWIEICDCPKGYTGESCESCVGEFYETCQDTARCLEECDSAKTCFDCHRCYEHTAYYHRNIHDTSKSVFGACEDL